MTERLIPFTSEQVEACTELYMQVFNNEPWNETWTYQSARERLTDLQRTPKFLGYLLYKDDRLMGFIAGNSKKSYTGFTFYAAELCIDNWEQGNGYGTKLLTYLEERLKSIGVESLYLLTANDGKAKVFYQKNDYFVHDNRVVMKKFLSK
ncbi:GNAT family N-acetyltransferase [Gracilibacillus caseinilyticus]|uniref:GNAT family N-acetyltransferase n=1 Tax=Gracilibacillus caseinilyticus TaxID=2932256 RepID=A0ABY4F0V4_9BACI|nr:GNAT family N-acetyltransferase [Gracilibacillus caseinilyticus]UOQ50160.1 GNAT family N-acetyltransferase [Gracilibacillus caseinilyticus]